MRSTMQLAYIALKASNLSSNAHNGSYSSTQFPMIKVLPHYIYGTVVLLNMGCYLVTLLVVNV